MIVNKILVNLDTPEAWYTNTTPAFVVTILIVIGWIIGTSAMYRRNRNRSK